MQNQYFGDVKDYLKYGLLRCFSDAGWRPGICWMLRPDDGGSDGRKIGYLEDAAWRQHDPQLFDSLKSAVITEGLRSISVVEANLFIPHGTFFSEMVPDRGGARSTWLENALTTLSTSDLLFFDPDNGLEIKSKPWGRAGSSKYLYWREVARAWQRQASMLIFQHFTHEKHGTYTQRRAEELQQALPDAIVTTLTTDYVLFLLACQRAHKPRAAAALQLVRSRWMGRVTVSQP